MQARQTHVAVDAAHTLIAIRVVPRACRVCAQGAVLCKLFALSVSIIAQFVLFWLAELRPRRKTVQIIALQQEIAHYKQGRRKARWATQTARRASSQRL
jgi:hypothetical protein